MGNSFIQGTGCFSSRKGGIGSGFSARFRRSQGRGLRNASVKFGSQGLKVGIEDVGLHRLDSSEVQDERR
jgi:hypothetical protein